jgi:hypothetical protein
MEAFCPTTDQREANSSANNTVSARNWKLEERGNHEPYSTAHCNETDWFSVGSRVQQTDTCLGRTYLGTRGSPSSAPAQPSHTRTPPRYPCAWCRIPCTLQTGSGVRREQHGRLVQTDRRFGSALCLYHQRARPYDGVSYLHCHYYRYTM